MFVVRFDLRQEVHVCSQVDLRREVHMRLSALIIAFSNPFTAFNRHMDFPLKTGFYKHGPPDGGQLINRLENSTQGMIKMAEIYLKKAKGRQA